MTGQNIVDETQFITKTDDTTYPEADILNGINYIHYPETIMDVLQYQGYRNLTMEHAYTDIVSTTGLSEGDNGYKGEYAFPTDLLRIKRIELALESGEYKRAEIYDISQNNTSEYDDDDTQNLGTDGNPLVRISRDSFFIRPLPTTSVTNGIYIEYEQRQDDITVSDSPNFEQSFHYVLVLKGAIRYAMREQGTYNSLWQQQLTELQRKMKLFYRDRIKTKINLPMLNETYE